MYKTINNTDQISKIVGQNFFFFLQAFKNIRSIKIIFDQLFLSHNVMYLNAVIKKLKMISEYVPM